MKVVPVKTRKIKVSDNNLFTILDKYLTRLEEESILCITSKIVSICQGRVIKIGTVNKDRLIKQEADCYLSEKGSKYGLILTIKDNLLIPSSGIDESNGAGFYILWPKNPQETANQIRKYLQKRFQLKKIGVIITDSRTTPLRRGTTGVCIAYSGLYSLKDHIGKPDLFGRKFKAAKVNVVDALAVAAVLVMGESNEQTPLAVITDASLVRFNPKNPAKKELADFKIDIQDDLYAPLLTSIKWNRRLHGTY